MNHWDILKVLKKHFKSQLNLTIGNGNGLTHHSVPLLNINKETKKNKQRLNKQKKSIKRLFLLLLLEFISINNFKTITSYNDDFNFKIKNLGIWKYYM